MTITSPKTNRKYSPEEYDNFAPTGPGTLAGDYLRSFWQPVYHSDDLPSGRAKPIKIMNQEYTLYRGTNGDPHLVDFRCAHRGMQLSPGWVQGDTIRCFYHGWVYDGTGQCVEQPAEPQPFCDKIRIGGYPVQDYLGLVFAYLGAPMGEGTPPEFPRYPDFEEFEGLFEIDSYPRGSNYFLNLENGGDLAHVGFVHRGMEGSFDGFTERLDIEAEESEWGVKVISRRVGSANSRTAHYGMPNTCHITALPNDTSTAPYREFLAWWVPVDDESHIQFTVYAIRVAPADAERYVEMRDVRLANRSIPKEVLAQAILEGRMRLDDVVHETTDMVRLQDDIAQIGQGHPDRRNDRLGRSDATVIMRRKLWRRELQAFAEGRPLTEWVYDPENQKAEGDF